MEPYAIALLVLLASAVAAVVFTAVVVVAVDRSARVRNGEQKPERRTAERIGPMGRGLGDGRREERGAWPEERAWRKRPLDPNGKEIRIVGRDRSTRSKTLRRRSPTLVSYLRSSLILVLRR